MHKFKVVLTDHGFKDIQPERRLIEEAGGELEVFQCKTVPETIEATKDADALLVTWAPVTAEVIASLEHCKVIVRMGIGVDNVDIPAATARGIAVCNVPDYGVDEVADHAVSLALALARQLPALDARVRGGVWKALPDAPMPAYREMTFATAGFGRIGRSVLERAHGFKFRLAAYDPFVPDDVMAAAGVTRLSLDELFSQADILSLHLPLNEQTRHIVNAERLRQMKPHAIVVNTARGALIDTTALAFALNAGIIAGAGLDVFEAEPLPADHPLRAAPSALLTSHVAWYSESSVPRLQRMSTTEVLRAFSGEPFRNQLNKV